MTAIIRFSVWDRYLTRWFPMETITASCSLRVAIYFILALKKYLLPCNSQEVPSNSASWTLVLIALIGLRKRIKARPTMLIRVIILKVIV